MPKVSVYITCHNYGRFLKQSIESVLCQKFDDWELIVIDDGSTDETPQVFAKYEGHPKITFIRQENSGLPTACNRAIRASKGKYIIRLDADDYFDENALLILSNVLDKHPEIGLVYPDYYLVSYDGDVLELVRRKKLHDETRLLDLPAHGAGTMIRRSCFDALNGYQEDFPVQDGYDLWIRFIDKFKPYNVNLPLFYYRRHGENSTENANRILSTRRRIKHRFVEEKYGDRLPRVLAVIPTRKDAPFCPGLALEPVAGKPLIAYTIEAAQAVPLIDHIVVVSEDSDVVTHAQTYGVDTLVRPSEFAEQNLPIEPTITFTLDQLRAGGYEPDIVALLHVNSPLRQPEDIAEAIGTLLIFDCDSVISVCMNDKFLYRHMMDGLEPLFKKRLLRSEKESLYIENGAIYVSRRESITKDNVLGPCLGHIVMDEESSIHIDTEFDLWLAKKVFLERRQAEVNVKIAK